jgi:fucose 4-O-acetylase-like acetyltransferase
MLGETVNQLVTLCIFGSIGLVIARWLRVPVPARTWVLLVIAVVVGSFIGINTVLLSVFGVGLLLNWAIASCCLGVLVGLLLRGRVRHSPQKGTA